MDEFGAASPFADVTQSGIDYAAMNKGITPVFFIEPVPDEKATEAAGAVRMREQEMVRIHVAGDMLNVHCSPVLDEHKERFAVQYEAWKTKRTGRHIDGTPLKNWPMISPLRIAEFEAMGIFSVENLRDTSDNNIQKLADGRVWREKAKGWLESAEKNGASAKFAAENERLRNDMDEMRKQIAELSAQVGKDPRLPIYDLSKRDEYVERQKAAQETEPPIDGVNATSAPVLKRKPGRPRKEDVAA